MRKVADYMLKYEKSVEKFSYTICILCKRLALQTTRPRNPDNFKCKKCTMRKKGDTKTFVIPDQLPIILHENMLTFIEEQLISLVFVHQYVYLRGFGEVASKGHCINFSQNINQLVDKLPRLSSDIPIIVIKKTG